MFKNKLLLFSPLIVFGIIFIFSQTLYPSVQPKLKNLPIAIVNADEGIQLPNHPEVNMGQKVVDMVIKSSKTTAESEPAVKWIVEENENDMQKGLENRDYYAALVIPKDFSAKQASFKTPAPETAKLEIFINQGMNTMASTAAGQIVNNVVDQMNTTVRTQLITELEKQGATLTPKQIELFANPVGKTMENVHETGKNSANGNSPISLFQPLWIACLASAAILFIATRKLKARNRKDFVKTKLIQLFMGAFIALVIGFSLTWLAAHMVGFHIPQFTDAALFLTITSFSFILMISAVLSLVGIKGIPLFALMFFFGAPLLSLPPEMMSSFYRDWIYSWLPMRFMIEGLRDLFFFGKSITWDGPLSILVWIGIISGIVILLSAFKPQAVNEKVELEQ
ncbi:DUF3533 domain-containing protein [Priestia flexa]|uniref:YhgE/Pip domain-containing protein n=1 Tax=Priestia flexa TaxID=86664 RepID=UPI002E21CFB4|nr:ABC transporter permease [Priestia flexa]MED3822641.1 DUF3533 domain-containing protein [Priestia flexa]